MINEFILYALIAGAVLYGLAWLIFKERAIAWVITVVIGLVVVLFVFPAPTPAKTLWDIAANVTLFIQKVVYAVGWGAGAFGISLVCKKSYE